MVWRERVPKIRQEKPATYHHIKLSLQGKRDELISTTIRSVGGFNYDKGETSDAEKFWVATPYPIQVR